MKEEARNNAVGLKLERIAYYLLYKDRPDTDFTELIYLHSKNGADMGHISHSYNFPQKFLNFSS